MRHAANNGYLLHIIDVRIDSSVLVKTFSICNAKRKTTKNLVFTQNTGGEDQRKRKVLRFTLRLREKC